MKSTVDLDCEGTAVSIRVWWTDKPCQSIAFVVSGWLRISLNLIISYVRLSQPKSGWVNRFLNIFYVP
jgi:hypothetical protein